MPFPFLASLSLLQDLGLLLGDFLSRQDPHGHKQSNGAPVLSTLTTRGTVVTSRAYTSRPHLDPACIETPATAAKGSKRPRASREDDPPMKRRHADGDAT
jgi:hypothetical protein